MDRNDMLMMRLSQLLNEIRQYVGARYVPRFIEGGWDATQAYEALDVVDNGQGTSYIAKKPVPVGTPLSDREYWFVYGASSGAIINLQNQIDAINSGIVTITSEINDIQDRNKLRDKLDSTIMQLVCIGDSFAEPGDSWANVLATSLGLTLGTNFFKSAHGGDGFKDGSLDNSFLNQLNALVVPDDNTITHLIVIGGTNDSGSQLDTGLRTNVRDFIIAAKTRFPNALIYVGFAATKYRAQDLTDGTIRNKSWAKYQYQLGCADGVARFIDNISESIASVGTRIGSDRVHPTTQGSNVIGNICYQALLGMNIKNPNMDVFQSGNYNDTNFDIDFTFECARDICTVTIPWQNIIKSGATPTFSGLRWVTMIPLSSLPITPKREIRKSVYVKTNDGFKEGQIAFGDSGIMLLFETTVTLSSITTSFEFVIPI